MIFRHMHPVKMIIFTLVALVSLTSCSRKSVMNVFYRSHTHEYKSPKHLPPQKCKTWAKIDSKKHLKKKAYGIKYSDKANKNQKYAFDLK